jgi:hypothetical protein
MEHDPGPRGSPQVPQGAAGDEPNAGVFFPLRTANTESCCSSFRPWHAGHCGRLELDPCTMVSNRWEQSLQTNSKIGMLHYSP